MREKRSLWDTIRLSFRAITSVGDQLDTVAAAEKIRGGVNIRGANVWILACSIIIASVGLNINSIPVIIGAMLISPLMGPIFGMGLSLYINDQNLLVAALKNYLVMVVVSLLAATVYFLISPLRMANPTELLARTSPTIYDVFIAFFGGIAGTLELSRKDRGTVISGVAIATALMPPLCTVGFGLASGNFRYAMGALYLFLINTVFILMATYFTARHLRFERVGEATPQNRRFHTVSSLILLAIIIPSVIGAIGMIRNNNTERNVHNFIEENKTFGDAYIYNYSISGGKARIFFAGELTDGDIEYLRGAAVRHGIDPDKLDISVNSFGAKADELLKGIYERASETIASRDARIRELEDQLNRSRGEAIPCTQITKELQYKYPVVSGLSLSRGSATRMAADSITEVPVTSAIVQSSEALSSEQMAEITQWLKLRLEDTTVVVNNFIETK
ncbi:MAG: TIGR00341 family protein [Bacteroidales bacterium]|nr:TIGR00341 family protein [Bacteroidales bacterium]